MRLQIRFDVYNLVGKSVSVRDDVKRRRSKRTTFVCKVVFFVSDKTKRLYIAITRVNLLTTISDVSVYACTENRKKFWRNQVKYGMAVHSSNLVYSQWDMFGGRLLEQFALRTEYGGEWAKQFREHVYELAKSRSNVAREIKRRMGADEPRTVLSWKDEQVARMVTDRAKQAVAGEAHDLVTPHICEDGGEDANQ